MSSVVTWIRKRSRLGAMIDAAGGVSVGSAVRAADENLAPLKDRGMETIRTQTERLAEISATPGATDERVQHAYRAAASILNAASPFGLNDVCAAALNLCEITDDHPAGGAFDWRVVDVHVQTFRLLMALGEDQAEARVAVLQGLQQVAAHKIRASQGA